jgi:hypothetical protein
MNPIKTFIIVLIIWLITLFAVGMIFSFSPEVWGASIIFMGINYLCYVLVKLSQDRK